MGKDSFNVGAAYKLLRRLVIICCCVLMFSDVAGVNYKVTKYAYIGQAAKLLSNINSHYEDISMYKETKTFIASWNGNTNTAAYMDPHYSGKIYMDKERNIWILGVEREDAGIYYLKFGTQVEKHEIILIVMGSRDFIFGLLITIMILVIMILVILIIIMVLMYEDWIRKCWKAGKNWIQEKLCSEYTKVVVTNEGSELTEHQVQNWLEGHPEFFENNESLVRSFLKLHPDCIEKYDENEYCHQLKIPSLGELGVTNINTETEVEVNQRQHVSSEMKGEHKNYLHDTTPTIEELGITLKGTEREGNLKQWILLQQVITCETCSNSSSDAMESFSDTDDSDVLSANKVDTKAAPKGDKAQTVSLDKSGKRMKKDPNSDEDTLVPLLRKAFNPK
ncbi:hypothetical protein ACJMK2_025686 [Sinanodonta woodiana]|uniref:Uncharacterized protein n=1 Tax=Sinanodonta woodiana TaxID=1069815 RepID=A0ABD3XH84_SINWO